MDEATTDWAGIILMMALAFDYIRTRKIDDALLSRIEDRVIGLDQALDEEIRRGDAMRRKVANLERKLGNGPGEDPHP